MPKIVDKEAKKKEILMAALHEFAEKGVNQTKISDIAQRAGIGKGTVYEYYPNKDAIFIDSMSFFMQSLENSLLKNMEGVKDPRQKIEVLIRSFTENAGESGDFLKIILDFWAIGLRNEQFSAWAESYRAFQVMISEIFEEGIRQGIFRRVDTKSLAYCLIGLLDGIIFQMILFGKEFSVDDALNAVIDNFLNGLLVSE